MEQERELTRQSAHEDGCSSSVVSFKDSNWDDRKAHIVNMTELSVRVESDLSIDPGVVWFNDRVMGHKGGILLWCQKYEERYRSVIRLAPLTREEERLAQVRTLLSGSHRPHRTPEEIIATVTQSLRRKNT